MRGRGRAFANALVPACASLVLVASCGEHSHEDPDIESCEHLTGGPYAAITAGIDLERAQPIAADDRAYTVALPPIPTGFIGYVSFTVDEAVPYIFYVDQDLLVFFRTAGEGTIEPTTSSTSSPACAEVKGRHVVPLEVGTVFVGFASETVETVDVVVEPALLDHDH